MANIPTSTLSQTGSFVNESGLLLLGTENTTAASDDCIETVPYADSHE